MFYSTRRLLENLAVLRGTFLPRSSEKSKSNVQGFSFPTFLISNFVFDFVLRRCASGRKRYMSSDRGSYAVVGRQKTLFLGALIGPKSLFCFSLIVCNFEIYAACCRNRAAEDTPRAHQHTSLLIPCAHGKLNAKHYRTTPKPETHITRRGRSCAGKKIENRAPKRIQAQQMSSSGTATTTRHHDYRPHTYDSKEHNYWVELVRVCRLAVVAAAAACCSFRDYKNPPPPSEARAIRREGRRAVSAQLAGRVVRTPALSFGRGWGLSVSKYPTCSNESSCFNTFDSSRHDCSNRPIFKARLSL